MDRRSVIGAGMALGASAVTSAPAISQSRLRLRIANAFSEQADGRGLIPAELSARLSGLSGDTLSIEIADYGGLAPETMLSALKSGEVDAIIGAEEFWMAEHPLFGLFSSLPGGLVERELEAWYRIGRGQDTWDAFAAEFGLKSLYLGDTGAEYCWSKGPAAELFETGDVTVATRGLAANVYTSIGADVRPLAPGILNPGDAMLAEPGPMADLASLASLGFSHITLSTVTRPSSAISMTFAKQRWDNLSANQRAVIDAAAMAQSHITAALAMKRNSVAQQIISLTPSLTVETAPDQLFDTTMQAARDVYTTLETRDQAAATVLREYRRFGEAVQSWTRVAEAPFSLNRARAARASG